jgi:hypothetical protein
MMTLSRIAAMKYKYAEPTSFSLCLLPDNLLGLFVVLRSIYVLRDKATSSA